MGEATAPLPALPETLEELHAVQAGLLMQTQAAIARMEILIQTAAAEGAVARFDAVQACSRLASIEWQMVRVSEALGDGVRLRTLAEEREALRAKFAPVPVPERPRSHRRKHARTEPDGQRGLWPVVGALAPVAAFLRQGLRHHVGTVAGHVVTAQHVALAAAGATLAVAAPLAVVAGVTGAGGGHSSSYGAAPNPAASIWSASPITAPSAIAGLVTHTRPRLDAKSSAPAPFLPWYLSDPPAGSGSSQPSVSSQPSQSSQVSVPASGPAVLGVSAPALDLTSLTSGTVTLTATGSGWVAWKVDAGGTDLDFSAAHGVLKAGDSYTLTVTIDPAQALDGNTAQTFDVNGFPVAVTLPPLPAVVPSPVDSVVPVPLPS